MPIPDPTIDPNFSVATPPGNWWEEPPPEGYTGEWPPPLPPGYRYGPSPGTAVSTDPSGGDLPGRVVSLPGWPDRHTQGPTDPPTKVVGPGPTPPPTTGPTAGPGPGPGPTTYDDNPWNPPKPNPLPPFPTINPPTAPQAPAFSYPAFDMGPEFKAPTMEEAKASPGYAFRVGQGEDSLQNWAAARGTLNDSSTAKSLIDYGENAATQEYQNVWNRDLNAWGANLGARTNTYAMNRAGALDTYNTNYKTQYSDPWLNTYTSWKDAVLDPSIHRWDVDVQNTEHLNDLNNTNAWNSRLFDWNKYMFGKNNELDRIRILMGLA